MPLNHLFTARHHLNDEFESSEEEQHDGTWFSDQSLVVVATAQAQPHSKRSHATKQLAWLLDLNLIRICVQFNWFRMDASW